MNYNAITYFLATGIAFFSDIDFSSSSKVSAIFAILVALVQYFKGKDDDVRDAEHTRLLTDLNKSITGAGNIPVISINLHTGILSPATPRYLKFYINNIGDTPIGPVRIHYIDKSPYGVNGDDERPTSNPNPFLVDPLPAGKSDLFYAKRYDTPYKFEYKFEVIWPNGRYHLQLKFKVINRSVIELMDTVYTIDNQKISAPDKYPSVKIGYTITEPYTPPSSFD